MGDVFEPEQDLDWYRAELDACRGELAREREDRRAAEAALADAEALIADLDGAVDPVALAPMCGLRPLRDPAGWPAVVR